MPTSVFEPKMRQERRFSVASPSRLRLCNAPSLHSLYLGLKVNIAALLSKCGLCRSPSRCCNNRFQPGIGGIKALNNV